MSKLNLEELSIDELQKLKQDAEKAIAGYEKRRRTEAKAELERVAERYGFKLSDFVAGKKTTIPSSAPKYRHPDNASVTWTGRGRQPKWIKEGLEAGKSLDDFAI